MRTNDEQIAHDRARAARLLGDDAQRLALFGAPLVDEQILGEEQDRGQRIVQLVRDAGDQLAERGELLRLAERLLGRAQRGHVFDVAVEVLDRARVVALARRPRRGS